MRDLAIRVDQLSKQYTIGKKRERFDSIGELVTHGVRGLLKAKGVVREHANTTFKALDKVSFGLMKGEALGIIGRNGSGKSTLLKILSRVTAPTAGKAEVYGRIGSLLEVGTGFHPELTGRENVYLNGAILGMKKAEIDRKFDAIVAFSEVEKFIDTPVKRYSSGMYTKLAFAVAAHLESEILIVDEVLAVGDFSFQRKCLGEMDHVTKQGRTVIFVSHNLSALQNLCTKGLVLKEGVVEFYGDAKDAVDHYVSSMSRHEYGFADLSAHPGRTPGSPTIIKSVGIRSNDKVNCYRETVMTGEDVVFEIRFDTGELALDYAVIGIESISGDRVCTVGTHLSPNFKECMRGKGIIECRIPSLPLRDGEYNVLMAIGRNAPRENIDTVENALQFRVELGDYFKTGAVLLSQQGPIAQQSNWKLLD